MNPEELHHYVRTSFQGVVRRHCEAGVRSLLESGSAEHFLTDLLFLALHADGHEVSREFPLGQRRAVDLVLHGPTDLFIEAKQLHLKDGCRYAPANLAHDLKRHARKATLGIIYVLDERAAKASGRFERFGGANRKAKADVTEILEKLKATFKIVVPCSKEESLLKSFRSRKDGNLDVYAAVVCLRAPRAHAA